MANIPLREKRNNIQLPPARVARREESELYIERAKIAASEGRFDVARVFCDKARAVNPESLHPLYVLARVEEAGFGDLDAAMELYQKVIALSGYDGANPYCAAARQALSKLASGGNPQG